MVPRELLALASQSSVVVVLTPLTHAFDGIESFFSPAFQADAAIIDYFDHS